MFLALTTNIPVALGQGGGTPSYDPRYDLTKNAVVDSSDADVAASSWSDLQGSDPCAPGVLNAADVNGDGCVDLVDMQLLLQGIGSIRADRAGARPAQGSALSTWVVTAGGDDPDITPGDGVCRANTDRCTLRAAIQEANLSIGPDRIEFNVRNTDGTCPSVVNIFPDSAVRGMLTLDDPNGHGTTIDGYTQCGASPNTEDIHGNAVIKIDLRGRFQLNIHGLRILSPGNVVRGIAVFNWDRQIEVYGGRARYNRIEGTYLGTNAAQTFTSPGMGTHHSEGIRLQIGARHNVIGCGSFDANDQFIPCTDRAQINAARNIVAGNGNDGIHFERIATYNRIVGNYVGLKQDGTTALRNQADGVDIEAGPQYNWLGGLTAGERNVISGNGSEGLEISHNSGTQFNHVVGNYFGTDATGMKSVQNNGNGVSFEDTVDSNYAYNNYVAGNRDNGFRFYVLATRNHVHHNIVGLAVDGSPLPNKNANGVYVMGGSSYNLISQNVIAHHQDAGVVLSNTSDATHNGFGTTYYNTISKNTMYENGREGIIFTSTRDIFANENQPAPTITVANTVRVRGTACANCRIEVFVADKAELTISGVDQSGEGKTFIGEGMTDGTGSFVVEIQEVPLGTILTATATNPNGSTSRFSKNIAVTDVLIGEPTAVPTLTLPPEPSATPTETTTATSIPTETSTPISTPTVTPTSGTGTSQVPAIWLPIITK